MELCTEDFLLHRIISGAEADRAITFAEACKSRASLPFIHWSVIKLLEEANLCLSDGDRLGSANH